MKLDSEKICWDGLEFPVQVDKIHIFEKNNPGIIVNVFSYDKEIKTIRIKDKEDREKTINLLLISNDKTNHYCWIKSMSRLLNSQSGKGGNEHKRFYCMRCLISFKTEKSLEIHSEYCKDHDAVKSVMPEKGTMLKFKEFKHGMRAPWVVYSDFEALNVRPIDGCQPNNSKSFTQQRGMQKASGYCYIIICYDNNLMEPILRRYTAKTPDEDIGLKYITALEKDIRLIHKKFSYPKKVKMSEDDNTVFEEATQCHICNEALNGDKVLDHDHYNGKYRGAAHNQCNINYTTPKHIPVIFHNLSGYDCHLFIKTLGVSEGKINVIPNNEEKYISFTKRIQVASYINKKGKTVNKYKELRFIDSYKFMLSGLSNLVKNLTECGQCQTCKCVKQNLKCGSCSNCLDHDKSCQSPKSDNMRVISKFYEGDKLSLLLRKGVFPYDHFDSLDRLKETALPPIEAFYNELNKSNISATDYHHAQKVWETFEMKTMREYHDLYMKSDVLLLADVFETHRDMSIKNYGIDPAWNFTLPGESWEAMLKMTKVKLELLSDVGHLDMINDSIRGGVSTITHRYR